MEKTVVTGRTLWMKFGRQAPKTIDEIFTTPSQLSLVNVIKHMCVLCTVYNAWASIWWTNSETAKRRWREEKTTD